MEVGCTRTSSGSHRGKWKAGLHNNTGCTPLTPRPPAITMAITGAWYALEDTSSLGWPGGKRKGGLRERNLPFQEPAYDTLGGGPRADESPVHEPALQLDRLGGTLGERLIARVRRIEERAGDAALLTGARGEWNRKCAISPAACASGLALPGPHPACSAQMPLAMQCGVVVTHLNKRVGRSMVDRE